MPQGVDFLAPIELSSPIHEGAVADDAITWKPVPGVLGYHALHRNAAEQTLILLVLSEVQDEPSGGGITWRWRRCEAREEHRHDGPTRQE